MSPIRTVERHFSAGLHRAPSLPRADLQTSDYANVAPAGLAAVSELDQLFKLRDLSQATLEALRPVVSNGYLLKPASLRAALNSLPDELRNASMLLPDAASSFGRAALLISKLIWLVDQGLAYETALVAA